MYCSSVCPVAAADHTSSDCFACILSSHGSEVGWYKEKHVIERTDIVFAKDGYLFIEDILKYFREDKSPSLKGKPKLFFIQVSNIFIGQCASSLNLSYIQNL